MRAVCDLGDLVLTEGIIAWAQGIATFIQPLLVQ